MGFDKPHRKSAVMVRLISRAINLWLLVMVIWYLRSMHLLNGGYLHRQHSTNQKSKIPTNSVGICVLARNENRYLEEWVKHHLDIGVEKIYLYDHNSELAMENEIPEYVQSGQVLPIFFNSYDFELTAFDNYTHGETAYYIAVQLWAYRDCLKHNGPNHDWLAFIDVDEFILLSDPAYKYNLPGFMKKYKKYAALGVQWRVIGSSRNELPPEEGVRKSYTHCLPKHYDLSRTTKMILQPKYTEDIIIHVGNFTRPYVLPNRQKVEYSFYDPQTKKFVEPSYPMAHISNHDEIVIYHYVTRSLSEAREKGEFIRKAMEKKTWWGTGWYRRFKDKKGKWDKELVIGEEFMNWVNRESDKSPDRCLEARSYVTK